MQKDRDVVDRDVKSGEGWSCTIVHNSTRQTLAIGTSLDHEAAIARAFAKLCRKTFGERGEVRSAEWIVNVRLERLT